MRSVGSNRRTVAAGTVSTTVTSSAPTASSATTTATATAASSSALGGAHVRTPERAGAVGVEAGRQPGAAQRGVGRQRADRGGGGQPQVERRERDQRAEQQPVDARAGVVDVGGQHAPIASAATSSSPIAASVSIRRVR